MTAFGQLRTFALDGVRLIGGSGLLKGIKGKTVLVDAKDKRKRRHINVEAISVG